MSVANAWCFGAKRTNDEYLEATKAEVASANHLLGLQSQALTLLQVASLNSRVALERKDENSELKPNGDVRCYYGDDDDDDDDDDSDSLMIKLLLLLMMMMIKLLLLMMMMMMMNFIPLYSCFFLLFFILFAFYLFIFHMCRQLN